MKKISCYLLVLFISLWAFTACKKMDRNYKDFIVPGGIVYAGKASSPVAYVGRNRVLLSWLRGSDPSVVSAKVFWNNYMDSTELNIPSTGDTVKVTIDNLPERTYSFMIRTYDADGNSSVPVEVLTTVYGEQYQEGLLSRPVNSSVLSPSGTEISIEWGAANISGGAIATDVKYTDTLGEERVLQFPASEATSEIPDIKAGTAFQFRTIYLPDSLSIDTFYTDYETNNLTLLDKTGWKVIDFSAEYPNREDTKVGRIIDGDPTTRWHTTAGHLTRGNDFVIVDMNVERTITYFEAFRDNGDDRGCDSARFLVSTDNVTWTDVGIFPFNRFIDAGQRYEIPSHPKARYWKFVGTGGGDFMVMGEINVYGY